MRDIDRGHHIDKWKGQGPGQGQKELIKGQRNWDSDSRTRSGKIGQRSWSQGLGQRDKDMYRETETGTVTGTGTVTMTVKMSKMRITETRTCSDKDKGSDSN